MNSQNTAIARMREAARKAGAEQSERHAYLSKLFGVEGIHADAFDDLENDDLYPSNRYFPITVYIDPNRIRTEKKRAQILQRTKGKFRKRKVRMQTLDPKALSKFSISYAPRFERLFLKRGYATNVEGRTVSGKGRPKSFKVIETNKAIMRANAHIWTNMLAEQSGDLFRQWSQEQLNSLASAMLGMTKENRRFVPLVRYKNLFLGTKDPRGYPFHLAYSTTPKEAMQQGQRDIDRLFGGVTMEALAQIEFEFFNAHKLFGGARRTPMAKRHQASSAIMVWFSQVVAAQRRVVWDKELRRNWAIELRELLDEKKLHKRVVGAKVLSERRVKSKTLSEQIDDEKETLQDKAEDIWKIRPGCIHEISLDERMLAALHGITVDLTARSEYDFFESQEYLIVLARWIGELKRTGIRTFDEHIARCVRLGWSYIAKGDNCLLGQFPQTTWLKLVSMAGKSVIQRSRIPNGLPRLRIDGYAGRFDVTYEWVTSLTHHEPPACTWQDGVLALRGPLTCFPVDQLAYWKRKAAMVSKLGGFWAPKR